MSNEKGKKEMNEQQFHHRALQLYRDETGHNEPPSDEAYIDWLEAEVVLLTDKLEMQKNEPCNSYIPYRRELNQEEV